MSIIEQAAKRLEELSRAGVAVPWAAAGLEQSDVQARVESGLSRPPANDSMPVLRRPEADFELPGRPDGRSLGEVERSPPKRPIPVVLDLARLEGLGLLLPTQTRSPLAEEFRHIKRPLLKNARSEESAANRLGLIMVTSALPGEGKTTCAINLAMSLAAEIDLAVLLVDADVLRPDVPRRLGIDAGKGLLDLLTDRDLDLSEVILQTNIAKLMILPAGSRNHLSTELLASEAMEDLLASLGSTYPGTVVVFDAPPLLLTNEAKVLASRVGQVVMVVDASKTQPGVAAQAFDVVEQCPIVMSVLNKAPQATGPQGYGYYYG